MRCEQPSIMNAHEWALKAQTIVTNQLARRYEMQASVSRFADAMEDELKKHENQFASQPWPKGNLTTLEDEARKHLYVLRRLLDDKRRGNNVPDAEIKKRAVHVANYMMMISDNLTLGRVK